MTFSWKMVFLSFGIFLIVFFARNVFAAPPTPEERAELERALIEVEKQIVQTEGIIGEYQEKGKTLKQEIGRFDKEIQKTNLKIRALDLSIRQLDAEIDDTVVQVNETESQLKEQKDILRNALQNIYEKDTETIVEILLQSPSLSHFFSGMNDLLRVQEELGEVVQHTARLRDDLIDHREQLALTKGDQETLKMSRDHEKKSLQTQRSNKDTLLVETKGQEKLYQQILEVSKQTAAQIRSRIFEFLGGGQLTFEQAYELARLASRMTGTRAAMILAVLDKESALGGNVGQCGYQSAMHPTRDIPVFLELMNELGINPDAVKVSCAISRDGAYGGAMGPAQFIPSTWKLYKDRIAQLTGKNPPSPWEHINAFVATGLYLRDARDSNSCIAYAQELPDQKPLLQDRCAAAKYYAGSRWRSYRWTYGERVIQKATQFEKDIAQIGG